MDINPSQIRAIIRFITQRTGTPVNDEDLEQEAALKAVEAFRKARAVNHPRAFLMKIVRDTVRDHWRRRRWFEDLESVDPRFISEQPAFEDSLDSARRHALLREALRLLQPARRTLVELFYEQGHSIPEIARRQGRSVSAVKMDLLRARRELVRLVSLSATKKSR